MMRVSHFVSAVMCVLACGGCSLLNRPDRSRIDSGVVMDAMQDAPMDGGPDSQQPEPEVCDNNSDDDLDGSKDCADPDCAYQPACCEMGQGTDVLHEIWTLADDGFGDRWLPTPSGGEYPDRAEIGDEARVVAFGVDPYAAPGGMVTRSCVPLALGLHVKTRLTARGASQGDCAAGKVFAALSLTAAQDATPGERIASDLSVELSGCGELQVRVAGAKVGTTVGLAAGVPATIDVKVAPGIDTAGDGYLAVTATLKRTNGTYLTLVSDLPFLAQSELIRDAGACASIPGLYLALEGQGTQVEVSPLSAETLECVNPSQFDSATGEIAQLRAEDVGAQTWAGGGIAAPALFLEDTGVSEHPWNVLFDGTNDRRELERVATLGYALGHAVSDDGVAWLSTADGDDAVPKAGKNPPSCFSAPLGTCTRGVALREPSVLITADGEQFVSYAREETSGGNPVREIYALDVRAFDDFVNVDETWSAKSTPTLRASDVGCKSLRDPSFVPAPKGATTTKYWLFFTCIPNAGKTSIRAVRMGGASGLKWLGEAAVPVFATTKMGNYAAGGMWAPEVLAEVNEATGDIIYRMWFLAEDARHVSTTVGLGQWAPSDDTPPAFGEFPGNPVLTEDAPLLSGAACGGVCDITGLAVSRRGDQLYFLLAQTVNKTSDVDYRLYPLKQPWRSPWPE